MFVGSVGGTRLPEGLKEKPEDGFMLAPLLLDSDQP